MARFIDATRDATLISLSPALAETLAERAAATGEPQFCLRRQCPYVLLGPQDLRLPDLEAGLRYVASAGLPAYRRVGGGAAVLLDGDCLSFAGAIACRDIGRLDENFRSLTQPVRAGLLELGVAARFGRAEGSYCEGPQDLVVQSGRKIAGVAQALRRGYALVSGMILVRQDARRTTEFLQGFYRASRSPRVLRAEAVTSLAQVLGRRVDWEEVHAAIVQALGRFGEWETLLGLPQEEIRRAQALLVERRMQHAQPAASGGPGAGG